MGEQGDWQARCIELQRQVDTAGETILKLKAQAHGFQGSLQATKLLQAGYEASRQTDPAQLGLKMEWVAQPPEESVPNDHGLPTVSIDSLRKGSEEHGLASALSIYKQDPLLCQRRTHEADTYTREVLWVSPKFAKFMGADDQATATSWMQNSVSASVALRNQVTAVIKSYLNNQFHTFVIRSMIYHDDAPADITILYVIPCIVRHENNIYKYGFVGYTSREETQRKTYESIMQDHLGFKFVPAIVSMLELDGLIIYQNAASTAAFGMQGKAHRENSAPCGFNLLEELFGEDLELLEEMRAITHANNMFTRIMHIRSLLLRQYLGVDGHTWHQVQISRARDPLTMAYVYMVAQVDVSSAVLAQDHVQRLQAENHDLLLTTTWLEDEKARTDQMNQRLKESLAEALALRNAALDQITIDTDSPADKAIKLLNKFLEGQEVTPRETIAVRDVILMSGQDILQPVNFSEQISQCMHEGLDQEVGLSLINLLVTRRVVDGMTDVNYDGFTYTARASESGQANATAHVLLNSMTSPTSKAKNLQHHSEASWGGEGGAGTDDESAQSIISAQYHFPPAYQPFTPVEGRSSVRAIPVHVISGAPLCTIQSAGTSVTQQSVGSLPGHMAGLALGPRVKEECPPTSLVSRSLEANAAACLIAKRSISSSQHSWVLEAAPVFHPHDDRLSPNGSHAHEAVTQAAQRGLGAQARPRLTTPLPPARVWSSHDMRSEEALRPPFYSCSLPRPGSTGFLVTGGASSSTAPHTIATGLTWFGSTGRTGSLGKALTSQAEQDMIVSSHGHCAGAAAQPQSTAGMDQPRTSFILGARADEQALQSLSWRKPPTPLTVDSELRPDHGAMSSPSADTPEELLASLETVYHSSRGGYSNPSEQGSRLSPAMRGKGNHRWSSEQQELQEDLQGKPRRGQPGPGQPQPGQQGQEQAAAGAGQPRAKPHQHHQSAAHHAQACRRAQERSVASALMEVARSPPDHLAGLLQDANGFTFDCFAFNEATGGRPLSALAFALLRKYHGDTLRKCCVDETRLARYLLKVEDHYLDNPYHNRVHAADVLQWTHVLMTKGGVLKALQISDGGTLAIYLGAAVHDLGHKGLNNDYLVRSKDPLALIYNDSSPMENHHVAAAFQLMAQEPYDFLANAPVKVKLTIRKTIINIVLATDMKQHFTQMSVFKSKLIVAEESPEPTSPCSSAHGVDVVEGVQRSGGSMSGLDDEAKSITLAVALKCADLGNLASPHHVHARWVKQLEEEYFLQGDREKVNSMAVSALMDRTKAGVSVSQTTFFNIVGLPLFRMFCNSFPGARPMLQAAEQNNEHWRVVEEQVRRRSSHSHKQLSFGGSQFNGSQGDGGRSSTGNLDILNQPPLLGLRSPRKSSPAGANHPPAGTTFKPKMASATATDAAGLSWFAIRSGSIAGSVSPSLASPGPSFTSQERPSLALPSSSARHHMLSNMHLTSGSSSHLASQAALALLDRGQGGCGSGTLSPCGSRTPSATHLPFLAQT